MDNLLEADLNHILKHADADLQAMKGKRLFITGGTGLFGLWLLETIAWVNQVRDLDICATILTRQTAALKKLVPHLHANKAFTFVSGDIRDFDFPPGSFDFFVHGATTSARETFNNEDALRKFETVAHGTRHMLDFAVKCRPEKILYLGSGAYYGKQPENLAQIDEQYSGAPDATEPNAALGIGKRTAEFFCQYYGRQHELDIKIARCFSFYGPYLPLDIHYALGNFVADGLAGRAIQVLGDGRAVRSYLYMADLVIWLFRILQQGQTLEAYNVGSDQALSIGDLANKVGEYFGQTVSIGEAAGNGPVNRYTPSVSKVKKALSLQEWLPFNEGLDRMVQHVRAVPQFYTEEK